MLLKTRNLHNGTRPSFANEIKCMYDFVCAFRQKLKLLDDTEMLFKGLFCLSVYYFVFVYCVATHITNFGN